MVHPSGFAAVMRSLLPFLFVVGIPLILFGLAQRPEGGEAIIGFYHQKVLMSIGIAITLSVSLNIVNGFTGQFSLGHAGFMAIGGYVTGLVTYYGGFALFGSANQQGGFMGAGEWLFVGGLLLGGVLAAVAGYLVGLPSLRLRGDYLAIVTLGFTEIVRVYFNSTSDVMSKKEQIAQASLPQILHATGGSLGFVGLPMYSNLFWVFFFALLTILVAYRIKYSSDGRAMLAIREDEIAAEAVGINTAKYKVRAFVSSAFFAGIAGGLFAHVFGTSLTSAELDFQKSFDVIVMVVLGGTGSISGATLAAIILTVLPEWLQEYADYRLIIYSLLLIGMMLLRPQGLFGLREFWDLRWPFGKSPRA